MTLKVALIQKSAVPNDPAKNMELGISYLEKAKELGADLALFPEMWSTGYAEPFFDALNHPDNRHYVYERQKWSELTLTPSDSFVQTFCNTAKKLSIGVVLTGLFSGKKAPRNTALLIDRTGNILLRYDKVHTCDFSMEALLENGEDFPVCEFDGVKIGLMICFDREFPESARILMLNGAEIILVPNACDMNPTRLSQLSTRAMENMVGVAMANYPSDPSLDRQGWGQSCAFDPVFFDENGRYQDRTLCMLGEKEEISLVEFDLDLIRSFRQNEVWGNAYRKVNTYSALLSPKVEPPFVRQPITVPSVHIRAMHPQDLDDIMKIWLNENLDAHHFIDPSFWKEHLDEVRTAISDSDITVLTEDERVVGFLGMNQNYVEGLFVDKEHQGKGYGLALIRSAQENHPFLQLSVYQKNTSAIAFYQHCGFCILSEKTQSNQNFNEFLMEWRKTRRE